MRYDFLKQIGGSEGVEIHNLTDTNWTEFKFYNGFIPHTVTDEEIIRPDLISHEHFNTSYYLDIILLINNIKNPFELKIGMMLKIPKYIDIKTFISEYK